MFSESLSHCQFTKMIYGFKPVCVCAIWNNTFVSRQRMDNTGVE